MSEQRLIDANAIGNDMAIGWQKALVKAEADSAPTIDPETLPIVRELRAKISSLNAGIENLSYVAKKAYEQRDDIKNELERVTAERDAALKWVKELKSEKAAAIGELNGVLASVYRLTEFVDDEVHPVVDYDLYLQLRDMVDEVIRWEHADEWCPDGDHS